MFVQWAARLFVAAYGPMVEAEADDAVTSVHQLQSLVRRRLGQHAPLAPEGVSRSWEAVWEYMACLLAWSTGCDVYAADFRHCVYYTFSKRLALNKLQLVAVLGGLDPATTPWPAPSTPTRILVSSPSSAFCAHATLTTMPPMPPMPPSPPPEADPDPDPRSSSQEDMEAAVERHGRLALGRARSDPSPFMERAMRPAPPLFGGWVPQGASSDSVLGQVELTGACQSDVDGDREHGGVVVVALVN